MTKENTQAPVESWEEDMGNMVDNWKKGRIALSYFVIEKVKALLASQKAEVVERDTQLLKVVSHLVESDAGFESDCVKLDEINGREVSSRERILADLVSRIYRIVHPRFSTCSHPDWEKEVNNLLTELNK